MSVSIFDNELTETERRLKEKCVEFDEKIANTSNFLERMKLAQQKMQEIREAFKNNYHGDGFRDAAGKDSPAFVIPDYDDFRKAIRTRIIKNLFKEVRPVSADLARSPMSGRNNKSRLSTFKEISVSSNQRKKSRKETVHSNRPSAFGRTSKLVKEDQKKRNSALIETLGKKLYADQQATKKSKFGNHLAVPDAATAPRDSIDLDGDSHQRPSTLIEMRNSLFKFDAAFISSDLQTEDLLHLEDALSDLSDYDAEVELLQEDEEVLVKQQALALQVQLLQLDNKFLMNSSSLGLNVTNAFDDQPAKGHRFAQRVKLQEGYSVESIPSLFAIGSKLVEEKPYYSEQDASHLYFKLESPAQTQPELTIHKLKRNTADVVDFSKDQEIKQIVASSLSCCYSAPGNPDLRLAVHLSNNEVHAYKPQQDYLHSHFRPVEQLQVRAASQTQIAVRTFDAPVLLACEFTRQLAPIPLEPGLELYFNSIDGLRVEGVLPAGFSEEQFEAFKPQGRNWDIECLNRELTDHSIYKSFLLADLKETDKANEAFLDKAFGECIESQKHLLRILKFKREYLVRLAKKEKPAVLKLSMVRNYESFGLKKKVSELLVFLAEPHLQKQPNDAAVKDAQSLLKDRVKSSFLQPKSSFVFGKSVQQQLSKLRNEFERSCLLFSVDIDYDIELCYSKDTGAFFIRTHEDAPEILQGGRLGQRLADLSKGQFGGLFGELQADCRLEEPREGLWLLLPKNSESVLPNHALLQYDSTVARLSLQQARLI